MAQKTRHIFEINHVSEEDNTTYRGTFSCKKLSIRGYTQLQVAKARLNGGMYHVPNSPGVGIDAATDYLNGMLAQLEVSLVDTPDWWKLDEIGDMELVSLVFSEVVKFENSFRKRNDDSDRQGGSEKENSDTNAGGNARAVVGEEVSAALEP